MSVSVLDQFAIILHPSPVLFLSCDSLVAGWGRGGEEFSGSNEFGFWLSLAKGQVIEDGEKGESWHPASNLGSLFQQGLLLFSKSCLPDSHFLYL
jgi:hypothetical protein